MLDPGDDSHEGIAVVEQRIADAARPKTPAMPTQQPTTNPDETTSVTQVCKLSETETIETSFEADQALLEAELTPSEPVQILVSAQTSPESVQDDNTPPHRRSYQKCPKLGYLDDYFLEY